MKQTCEAEETLSRSEIGVESSPSECVVCSGELIQRESGLTDTRFGTEGVYSVAECARCGLEQTRPVPSIAELKRLYESHYNFAGEQDTAYTSIRERILFSSLYRLWLWLDGDVFFQGGRGTGRLLDVGCNEGRGLQLHARNGFQAEGLELNERAAAIARNRGFKVSTSLIENFSPTEPYDVLVISNVLEHTAEPQRMLAAAVKLLKPGGEIWISCPNSRSWLRKLCGRKWINWHVPFHLVHFSRTTLRALLEQAGFSQVKVKHETPSLWVASSIIAKLFAKPGRVTRELRNPILVGAFMLVSRFLLFPVLWFGNLCKRGDCLLATARKAQ